MANEGFTKEMIPFHFISNIVLYFDTMFLILNWYYIFPNKINCKRTVLVWQIKNGRKIENLYVTYFLDVKYYSYICHTTSSWHVLSSSSNSRHVKKLKYCKKNKKKKKPSQEKWITKNAISFNTQKRYYQM